ncbi:MAG: hypothetical protein ACRD50_10175 [Candidatus Acidiferrales bacterium]
MTPKHKPVPPAMWEAIARIASSSNHAHAATQRSQIIDATRRFGFNELDLIWQGLIEAIPNTDPDPAALKGARTK